MKTECNQNEIHFQDVEKKRDVANFDGGTITSHTGVLFLREIEKRCTFIERFSKYFADFRDPKKICYSIKELLIQRIFGICQGYEDLNDHDTLRDDPLFWLACERTERNEETGGYVSGKSTLNRLECGSEEIYKKERYKKISCYASYVNPFTSENCDNLIRIAVAEPDTAAGIINRIALFITHFFLYGFRRTFPPVFSAADFPTSIGTCADIEVCTNCLNPRPGSLRLP